MIVERVVIHEYELPLESPFSTAVRTIESLSRILVEVETDDGAVGVGECAPNYEVTGESGAGTAEILETVMAPILLGESPSRAGRLRDELSVVHGAPAAHAGVDTALYDLRAKRAGLPLYQFLDGTGDAPAVTTPRVVSMDAPEQMADEASAGVDAGHDQIKIKVGDDPSTDIERIRTVDEAIPDSVSLKADANQGWGDATTSLRVLSAVGDRLDAVEQPVHEDAVDDLRLVRERSEVPVMADEPVRSPRDAMDLIKRGAADLYNIKLMKAGGISPAARLNAVAAADGRPTQLGSMIEGEVGTAAGVHFVAAFDNVVWNELVGPLMTEGGITDLSVEGPEISTAGDGLGVQLDRDAMASLRTTRRVVE